MNTAMETLPRKTTTPTARVVRLLLPLLGVLTLIVIIDSASAAPLTGANANMDKVCTVAATGGAIADKTTAANDVTGSDLSMATGPLGVGSSATYFGMNEVFNQLKINVAVAGTDGAIAWAYWDGDSWETLSVTDGTSGLTSTGVNGVTFSIPASWAETQIDASNCSGTRYYLRLTTPDAYAITPLSTQVSAIEFNTKVKAQNELGTALTSLAESAFAVTDGTTNTIFGFRETGSGNYELALDTAGADINFNIKAAKDGYVTSSALASGALSTVLTDTTASPMSLSYAYKVTGVSNELGTALSSVTVLAGNAAGTTCVESGGAWYCPVPLSDTTLTISAAKDGYVTNTANSFASDRTAATESQVTAAVSTVRYAFKVTGVSNELGTALSSVTLATGNSYGTSCTESSGAWYCAVPLADTGIAISAAKDGYVTDTATSFASDRTSAADSQVAAAVTSVDFAFKVSSITSEASEALTGGTVTTGDSYGTTCTESSGVYYCAVPLANTGVAIQFVKDGYITNTASSFSSDRSTASAAQVTGTVTSVLYTLKVTFPTETTTSGITIERSINGAAYSSITAAAASGNVAYFA